MSDKYRGIDEPWDVEKALEERRERFEVAENRIKKQPLERPRQRKITYEKQQPELRERNPRRKQAAQTARPRKSRKKKVNYRGWAILITTVLIAVALAIGMIALIASIFSGDEETTTPTKKKPTQVAETTEPEKLTVAEVVDRADRLAQSYDYDAAIATLHTYGDDWDQQPALTAAETTYLDAQSTMVRWEDTTTIPHLSCRALIVDLERAFDGDEDEQTYNQSMLTIEEFRAILETLYEQDYVLVNMHDLVTQSDSGALSQGDIYLPAEKKPIILSQEDVNYYQYRVDGPDEDFLPDAQGDGFACKLMLDDDGKLTNEYIDADGKVLYGAYDFVPIVEEFVEQHPDFSYRGAKGVISVTGVEGVFGFQTHPDWESELGEDAYMEQIRQAQEVSATLKANGWEIACYGYSKISFADSDADTIAANLKRWDNQVAPITGKSDILFYPYGLDIGGVDYYQGDKYEAVSNAGFQFFCNMDASQSWVQLREEYMRQARRVIDGYRLEYGDDLFDDLFDVDDIIDNNRPRPVPSL